jgi:hypothetical protein
MQDHLSVFYSRLVDYIVLAFGRISRVRIFEYALGTEY